MALEKLRVFFDQIHADRRIPENVGYWRVLTGFVQQMLV
jgi:hypothetical protein